MSVRQATIFSLAFIVAAAGAQTPPSESERLNEWFELKYEEQLDFSSMQKTTLGRKEDYDRLDEVTEAAFDERFDWRRDSVRELHDPFDYELLTPEAQTS